MAKKTNNKFTKFKPTKEMLKLLEAKLNVEVKPTVTAEAKYAGISRTTYYEWFKDDNFVNWFNKEWEREQAKMGSWLDKVGYMKAPKDFRYWEAMQMKYQNFARKQENQNDNLNTDTLNVHDPGEIRKIISELKDKKTDSE